MRVTAPVTMFATAVWLASVSAPAGECSRVAALERRSAQGDRRAAVVEVDDGEGERIGSLVLLAEPGEADFDPERLLAAFDRRIEAMEWSGEDLLLGFAAEADVRAFSIYPGLRILPAAAPREGVRGLCWLRLSTRRSGR